MKFDFSVVACGLRFVVVLVVHVRTVGLVDWLVAGLLVCNC